MVAESPDIKTVLKQFIDFVRVITLVAHNAQFDIGFISKVLKENGISLNPCYIDIALHDSFCRNIDAISYRFCAGT